MYSSTSSIITLSFGGSQSVYSNSKPCADDMSQSLVQRLHSSMCPFRDKIHFEAASSSSGVVPKSDPIQVQLMLSKISNLNFLIILLLLKASITSAMCVASTSAPTAWEVSWEKRRVLAELALFFDHTAIALIARLVCKGQTKICRSLSDPVYTYAPAFPAAFQISGFPVIFNHNLSE